jgi:hypothetical protein
MHTTAADAAAHTPAHMSFASSGKPAMVMNIARSTAKKDNHAMIVTLVGQLSGFPEMVSSLD